MGDGGNASGNRSAPPRPRNGRWWLGGLGGRRYRPLCGFLALTSTVDARPRNRLRAALAAARFLPAPRFSANSPAFQPIPIAPMPKRTSPDLTVPLAQPIPLTRGPRSHLVTLMDAAILIRDLEPFRQARPVWDRAAEMILVAATTRKRDDIAEATRQVLVCVERENWWKPARAKELIE
jgi:hypothetical protein